MALNEDQKHHTGRAMLAMSAAHMETIAAVKQLLEHDPQSAHLIAVSAAKNLEQAANHLRLAVEVAPAIPVSMQVRAL